MPFAPPDRMITVAGQLADAARPIILEHFRSGIAIEDKPDDSPVTKADQGAEAAMRELIRSHLPDHGIVGEEYGTEKGEADWLWVLDPIDGTRAFITGNPLFGTLIGLLYKGEPVLGVIDSPYLQERWLGVSDRPTTLNGQPVTTSSCNELAAARMQSTSPSMFSNEDLPTFERLASTVRDVRYGGDCYCYGLLALGGVDLVCENSMNPYDFLALAPVVAGAGGVITNWQGDPLSLSSGPSVLASANPALHALALAQVKA
ncbi:MAG: histidinol-phosphatase [Magnetovibrionaceae bacterium]